jgi:hypothetical protein
VNIPTSNMAANIKVDLEFAERDIQRAQFFWGDDWPLCESRIKDAIAHINHALQNIKEYRKHTCQ